MGYGVAGMAGNAASQGVAIAAHQQQGFNTQAMMTQGVASAVTGGFMGATSSAGTTGAPGTAGTAGSTSSASAAQGVVMSDAAMNIATSEAIAAAQQAALMATGLQSKPDWKGFAVAAFNGAAGSSVKAGLGEGAAATGAYTGVTVTGDTLIRGEPVNGAVVSATMVGAMVGNYAGQKGLEKYQAWKTPAAKEQRSTSSQQTAPASSQHQPARQARPLAAHEKQTMAEASDIAQYPLSDPALDLGGASNKLSEINRTRMQRWNNASQSASQSQKGGYWKGVAEELKEEVAAIQYLATHPRELGDALKANAEANLNSFTHPRLFEARMNERNAETWQSASNIYHDVRNGDYNSLGHLSGDLATNLVPVGKVFGVGKVAFFARTGIKEVGQTVEWSKKARIKAAQLPNEGKVRFVPDGDYHPSEPLLRGPNKGYLDKFGNEWVKGPSRTPGQSFEWDVQLSPLGKKQLGWASRDDSHLNVSLDGRITHR